MSFSASGHFFSLKSTLPASNITHFPVTHFCTIHSFLPLYLLTTCIVAFETSVLQIADG